VTSRALASSRVRLCPWWREGLEREGGGRAALAELALLLEEGDEAVRRRRQHGEDGVVGRVRDGGVVDALRLVEGCLALEDVRVEEALQQLVGLYYSY